MYTTAETEESRAGFADVVFEEALLRPRLILRFYRSPTLPRSTSSTWRPVTLDRTRGRQRYELVGDEQIATTDPQSTRPDAILVSAQDCSFFNWRLIKSSACSASLC
jgi:hypothetical protein